MKNKHNLLRILSICFVATLASCSEQAYPFPFSSKSDTVSSSYSEPSSSSDQISYLPSSSLESSSSSSSSINRHVVSFDTNGGSYVPSQIVEHGEKITKPNDPTRPGYTFVNWTYLGEEWSFIGYVVTENITLVANWTLNQYRLTVNSSNSQAGSVYGSGVFDYNSQVTVYARTNTGYTFLGWYSGSRFLSEELTYTFTMGFDTTITARWNDGNTYMVYFDPAGGTVSISEMEVQYNHSYSFPTPNREGYYFYCWCDKEEYHYYSTSGTWSYDRGANLEATWNAISYSIEYDLNGGDYISGNPTSYTIESNLFIKAPKKTGYTFTGWLTSDGEIIFSITPGMTGDLVLTATWSANKYAFYLESEDNNHGSVELVSGDGYMDEEMIVRAVAKSGYVFDGWYDEKGRISRDETYSFIMPASDYSLEARFFTKEKAENIAMGIALDIGFWDKKATYGMYPTTYVSDTSLSEELDQLEPLESNSFYLYKGSCYFKDVYSRDSYFRFNNGKSVTTGESYWFKCEPIEWDVVGYSEEKVTLVSNYLLDQHIHSSPSNNNYKLSEVRAWINDYFYQTAFALDDSIILTTLVDNSLASTRSTNYVHSCPNTEDKVFLPSYQELTYKFPSYNKSFKCGCIATEYAKFKGVLVNRPDYPGKGPYYSRSPAVSPIPQFEGRLVEEVEASGSISGSSVCEADYIGIRPAITISLSESIV